MKKNWVQITVLANIIDCKKDLDCTGYVPELKRHGQR